MIRSRTVTEMNMLSMSNARTSRTLLIAICLGGLVLAAGCDSKKKEKEGETSSASTPTDTTPKEEGKEEGGAKEAAAPAKINEALMKEIKDIAASCDVNVDGNTVKCEKAEGQDKDAFAQLKDKFYKKTYDRIGSLDTVATGLADKDEKVQVVSSAVMYSVLGSFPDAKVGDVDAGQAKRLLDAFAAAPKYRAGQAMRTVVYANTLAGVKDDLYKVLEGHSYKYVQTGGFEHIMHYGRMDHFPKAKELAESDDDAKIRAGFRAILNMPKMTDAEKKEICPWAQGHLGSEKDDQFFGAGRVMIRCRGEYVDALLAEGEKRAKEHKFTRDYTMVYRDICFSMIAGLIKEPGVKEQCERNYKLLQSVVDDEKTDSLARGLSLFAIYYQRRDQESYDLMQKYKNHKDENVKKYALQSIESLEKHYLKDKKNK
ncbi:MAG: hypothetical protein VX475_06235 [Myxococcota bacterium]|nr:hypothetical protein [Myxococcota bacterium]